MLDGDFELGINSCQYQKVAKVSRTTRHLAQMVEQHFLVKADAGGRRYEVLIAEWEIEASLPLWWVLNDHLLNIFPA